MSSRIKELDPLNPKFEPGRPVWVLLHKDHSHIYPNPDGGPAWSYQESEIKLIRQILIKDFELHDYSPIELSVAFPLVCNKQAELEKIWSAEIAKIRKIPDLPERRNHYRRFWLRHKVPHPLLFDDELKRLLRMN